MRVKIPDISKQIYKEDVLHTIESRYSIIGPLWVNHQMEWCNRAYSTFKDHDKFLIISYLIKQTLDFYSRNFVKLNYEKFFSKKFLELEKFNVTDVSKNLNIPKETVRRKIIELEKTSVIKKVKKKLIIDINYKIAIYFILFGLILSFYYVKNRGHFYFYFAAII